MADLILTDDQRAVLDHEQAALAIAHLLPDDHERLRQTMQLIALRVAVGLDPRLPVRDRSTPRPRYVPRLQVVPPPTDAA